MVLVHLKNPTDEIDKTSVKRNKELIEEILAIEQSFFSKRDFRTILVGDFNMDPFDELMTDEDYFNTDRYLRYRNLVQQDNMETQPFFYNPMWRFLSDAIPDQFVCGTHIWKSKTNTKIHQQMRMFDQIIYRSVLNADFQHTELKIVHKIRGNDLILSHTPTEIQRNPEENLHLDHLPIIFEFRF